MSYIVHNLTKKTIVLSDLRAEIRPCSTLDLEKFAHRQDIERSSDLIQSVKLGKIRLVSSSAVRAAAVPAQPQVTQIITEKIVEKPSLTEEQLEEIIRKVMKENKDTALTTNLQKIIGEAVGMGLSNITDVLNKMGINETQGELQIDPEKLAQLQQQPINKVFEDLQTGSNTGREKKVVQSKNIDDLAKELE